MSRTPSHTRATLVALLTVAVLTFLPCAYAAASVTGATCVDSSEGWCLNNTVTFTGTDLASVASVRMGLTAADNALITCNSVSATATTVGCTLSVAASASTGLYPATFVLGNGTEVEAGSLLIGASYEQESLSRWTSTSNSSVHRVTGQSSDWPSTGDVWSVSGTFDTTASYSVLFYNNQQSAAAGNPSMPTCTPLHVTSTKLSCTILSANGVMGMFNFLVQDTTHNTLLLGSTALYSIAVNPPLPAVTGASGSCATSSAACVDGVSLFIAGTNFNYRNPTYQRFYVGVTSEQRTAIRLIPTAVNASGVNATLSVVEANLVVGSYPVFVRVWVCTGGMLSPLRYVGNLVLKSDSIAGFNTNDLNATTTMIDYINVPVGGGSAGDSAGYKAAIAFAVIFAVLFLVVLIMLIVVRCRYNLVQKNVYAQNMHLDTEPPLARADSMRSGYYTDRNAVNKN